MLWCLLTFWYPRKIAMSSAEILSSLAFTSWDANCPVAFPYQCYLQAPLKSRTKQNSTTTKTPVHSWVDFCFSFSPKPSGWKSDQNTNKKPFQTNEAVICKWTLVSGDFTTSSQTGEVITAGIPIPSSLWPQWWKIRFSPIIRAPPMIFKKCKSDPITDLLKTLLFCLEQNLNT